LGEQSNKQNKDHLEKSYLVGIIPLGRVKLPGNDPETLMPQA
jgi:hypothetical protein